MVRRSRRLGVQPFAQQDRDRLRWPPPWPAPRRPAPRPRGRPDERPVVSQVVPRCRCWPAPRERTSATSDDVARGVLERDGQPCAGRRQTARVRAADRRGAMPRSGPCWKVGAGRQKAAIADARSGWVMNRRVSPVRPRTRSTAGWGRTQLDLGLRRAAAHVEAQRVDRIPAGFGVGGARRASAGRSSAGRRVRSSP